MSGQTVLEQLVESLNQSKAFEGTLLYIVLVQEFRHWRARVDAAPECATLDEHACDRVAAKTTVQVVTSFFDGKHRADLEAAADNLIAKLLAWAGKKPALDMTLN